MAAEALTLAVPPGRPAGPPGLSVVPLARPRATAPAPASGVPVFIGFGAPRAEAVERRGSNAVVLSHWDARGFDSAIRPAPESHLRSAVRGFFANGGKRCVVLAVAPGGEGSDALVDVLRRGGELEDRSDIDLVCIPDAVSPRVRTRAGGERVHAEALAHCEAMGDRFAILDAPDIRRASTDDAVDEALRFAGARRSAFGALYFPWIEPGAAWGAVPPPAGHAQWRSLADRPAGNATGQRGFAPPCGHVAGLYARLDARVGRQRSPAHETLAEVLDTAVHLSAAQHARLNQGGVNALVGLPGRGIQVGGARTLSGHGRTAHVSAVRVVLGFRHWLATNLRDLVFEPQTARLQEGIRVRLVGHCLDLLAAGALAGASADEAFFVKCDAETNPASERELGRVVAHVGLAPSVPAEFIVVRVVHDVGGPNAFGASSSIDHQQEV